MLPTIQAGQYDLRTTLGDDGARALVDVALANPQVRQAANDKVASDGAVAIAIEVVGGTTRTFTYDGSSASPGGSNPAYTVSASRDTALGIVNSDDRGKMLACAVAAGYVSIRTASAAEQAAVNAAKSQAASGVDCSFGDGSAVTFRGLTGTAKTHDASKGLYRADLKSDLDFLVLNKFGAPIGWQEREAERLAGDEEFDGYSSWSGFDIAGCISAATAIYTSQLAEGHARLMANPFDTVDWSAIIEDYTNRVAQCNNQWGSS